MSVIYRRDGDGHCNLVNSRRMALSVFICLSLVIIGCKDVPERLTTPDAGADGNGGDADSDADTDTDTDSDTDVDTDADGDTDTDSDTDVDTDADGDTDTDSDTDVDTDADGDTDTDSDTDVDTDSDFLPGLEVFYSSTALQNGQSLVDDFPDVDVDGDGGATSQDFNFTIKNTGSGDLIVTNIYLSGPGANDFDIMNAIETPIQPSSQADLITRFDPRKTGEISSTLTIESNDTDESPFTFLVAAKGVDISAPSPGNGGVIVADDIGTSEITIQWGRATDHVTAQPKLRYKAVISESNNIDSVQLAELNGTTLPNPGADWVEDLLIAKATALKPDRPYYFNVIVMDLEGNKSVYSVLNRSTASSIRMYGASVQHGNLGGREGADQICEDQKPSHFPSTIVNFKAFLSVSEDDEMRDLPTGQPPLPTNREIRGEWNNASDKIAEDFDSLWEEGPIISFQDAGVTSADFWFNGANTDGSVSSNCCEGWTAATGSGALGGSTLATDIKWIRSGSVTPVCEYVDHILCLAW